MRLRGIPPDGVPILSFVGSPTGSILGSAELPIGRLLPVPGPPGPPGGGIFTHTQTTPAATWTITHTLGRKPASVSVWMSDALVDTDVDTPDISTVVLTFNSPQSGSVRLI